MGKNVTMKDIAEVMNVSTVTVSKALSDKDGVSDKVREQIKIQAEKMGYRYNSLAKGIKEGKTQNLGVLVAARYFDDNAYYNRLYTSLVVELGRVNYSGILEILSAKDEKEGNLPQMLLNGKVDGIIILGQVRRSYVEIMCKGEVPVVFWDFYDEDIVTDSVVGDNIYGSYQLTNYLIKMGHRKIGFLGSVKSTTSILDRYLGYYKALIENDIPLRKEWVLEDRTEDGEFVDFQFPKEMPDAFVCNCDQVAYLFIKKLKKSGYRVPDDISVVGFDDYIFATFCSPQLTTFCVSMKTMAKTVVDSMMQKIANKEYSFQRKVISGNLVVRDSVKDIRQVKEGA